MTTLKEFDEAMLAWLQKVGGPTLVCRILDLFFEHAPKRLAAARLGLQEGDLEAVEREAHSLKSSAGHIGAEVMQDAANTLERLARAQEREIIPEQLHALEKAFARLVPILEQHRKALDTQ